MISPSFQTVAAARAALDRLAQGQGTEADARRCVSLSVNLGQLVAFTRGRTLGPVERERRAGETLLAWVDRVADEVQRSGEVEQGEERRRVRSLHAAE